MPSSVLPSPSSRSSVACSRLPALSANSSCLTPIVAPRDRRPPTSSAGTGAAPPHLGPTRSRAASSWPPRLPVSLGHPLCQKPPGFFRYLCLDPEQEVGEFVVVGQPRRPR